MKIWLFKIGICVNTHLPLSDWNMKFFLVLIAFHYSSYWHLLKTCFQSIFVLIGWCQEFPKLCFGTFSLDLNLLSTLSTHKRRKFASYLFTDTECFEYILGNIKLWIGIKRNDVKREEPVTWEELDEIVHCEPYVTDEQTEATIRSENGQHHTVAKSHTRRGLF